MASTFPGRKRHSLVEVRHSTKTENHPVSVMYLLLSKISIHVGRFSPRKPESKVAAFLPSSFLILIIICGLGEYSGYHLGVKRNIRAGHGVARS